jgi:NADH:ubiquinone oxidoreductase subunit H
MSLHYYNLIEFFLCSKYLLDIPQGINTTFLCTINMFIVEITILLGSCLELLYIKTTVINPLIFTVKFLLLVSLLIFIRGGIPRYRYDFLTKLG